MNRQTINFIKDSFLGSKEQINQIPISKYEINDGFIYYIPQGMNDNSFKIVKLERLK